MSPIRRKFLLLFVLAIFLQFPISVLLQELRDYCFLTSFNATCPKNFVVVMEVARYGRMRRSACLTSDSAIGCSLDVLTLLDLRCSGRRQCTISLPDPVLHKLNPCHNDMISYLEAKYHCVRIVASNTGHACTPRSNVLVLSNPQGYLSSLIVDDYSSGGYRCPWEVTVPAGQRINITLLDFGLEARQERGNSLCTIYAKIKEAPLGTSEGTVCGDARREKVAYLSEGNSVEITLMSSYDAAPPNFLLKYEAIGCPNPEIQLDAWFKRDADKATVSCNFTNQVWHIVCSGGRWLGALENCTTTSSRLEEAPRLTSPVGADHGFPFSLVAAVLAGLVIGILIGVALLTCVIIFHRRRKKASGFIAQEVVYSRPPSIRQIYASYSEEDGRCYTSAQHRHPLLARQQPSGVTGETPYSDRQSLHYNGLCDHHKYSIGAEPAYQANINQTPILQQKRAGGGGVSVKVAINNNKDYGAPGGVGTRLCPIYERPMVLLSSTASVGEEECIHGLPLSPHQHLPNCPMKSKTASFAEVTEGHHCPLDGCGEAQKHVPDVTRFTPKVMGSSSGEPRQDPYNTDTFCCDVDRNPSTTAAIQSII